MLHIIVVMNDCRKLHWFLRTSHLERAIAKDLGEDRGREVGDDREQDRHPGCVQDDQDKAGVMFV